MLDKPPSRQSIADQIIALSADAVPEFILKCTAEKTLSAAVSELNKLVLFGGRDEKETAEEALTRLGFIHPIAQSELT